MLQYAGVVLVVAAVTRLITCAVPGCGAEFPAKDARQHAAWHIQAKPESVTGLAMPCGLCAAYEQVQYTSDAGAPGCCVWLENADKRGKATIPHTRCKVVGELPYRQASALKSSKASPATNHIVACPACPSAPMKQYFWSYNMPVHWRNVHGQQPMPPDLRAEIEPSAEELALLAQMKEAKLTKRKRDEREQRQHAKSEAAKLARLTEQQEAQPLGRGQRVAARAAAASETE